MLRVRVYPGNRPISEVHQRTVMVVDDGIATKSTLRAAIATWRQQQSKRIPIAPSVTSTSTCKVLKAEVDKVVCLISAQPLYSIRVWYQDFWQNTDEKVRNLLA